MDVVDSNPPLIYIHVYVYIYIFPFGFQTGQSVTPEACPVGHRNPSSQVPSIETGKGVQPYLCREGSIGQ